MLDYKYYNSQKETNIDTLILLHGIGGNSNIFYKQLDEFRKHFNVLTVDLPGHGNSPDINDYKEKFSYDLVVNEIVKTMKSLAIEKAHFIGISLGSIIIHHILQKTPERVKSAVLGGSITDFNILSKLLFLIGKSTKKIIPHMWLYQLIARIMMPKANHTKSRNIFINEAKKMKKNNFLEWFNLIPHAQITYKNVQKISQSVPKLYISGKEDHLFIKKLLKDINGDKSAKVLLLKNCGHVCNIEQPSEFNTATVHFIKKYH